MSAAQTAVVILAGLALGLSLTFAVLSAPHFRRPKLADRLGPHLRTTKEAERRYHLTAPARPGLRGLFDVASFDAVRWLNSRLTTDASVQTRLDRLGPAATLENFRATQIMCVVLGIVAGGGLATLITVARGLSPVIIPVLIGFGALAGHLFNDWWLSQKVKKRESRILAEFPTVAEVLALSITAGEGTVDALERVSRTTHGELSGELSQALAQARTGTPLVEALDAMARRTGIPGLIQFVDALAVAIARGTPLSEVLRAQAADVRDDSRRHLMELSGKKEVGMLVPVVMFVLPITVLFAVYPSLAVLEIGP